jgi:ABC-type multidrug transport system fused ATPase/permease subunit
MGHVSDFGFMRFLFQFLLSFLRISANVVVGVNTLPQIVKALVLYYGGLLVVNGEMTGGELVTFILYLSALAESFNSLAGIYATLTRAVGGADKVFELMNREPQFTRPSHVDEERVAESVAKHAKRVVGIECTRVVEQRVKGLHPEECAGEITLSNVEMRYPSRPQRVVLDDLSVTIPPGAIVALVGSSGSGKSSVVSLIQHLYEPTKGEVCIDGVPVSSPSGDMSLSTHLLYLTRTFASLEGARTKPRMDIETCCCRYAGTYARKSFDQVTCYFPDHPIPNTLSSSCYFTQSLHGRFGATLYMD